MLRSWECPSIMIKIPISNSNLRTHFLCQINPFYRDRQWWFEWLCEMNCVWQLLYRSVTSVSFSLFFGHGNQIHWTFFPNLKSNGQREMNEHNEMWNILPWKSCFAVNSNDCWLMLMKLFLQSSGERTRTQLLTHWFILSSSIHAKYQFNLRCLVVYIFYTQYLFLFASIFSFDLKTKTDKW